MCSFYRLKQPLRHTRCFKSSKNTLIIPHRAIQLTTKGSLITKAVKITLFPSVCSCHCIITLHLITMVNVKIVYYIDVTKRCSTVVIKFKKNGQADRQGQKTEQQNKNKQKQQQQQQQCNNNKTSHSNKMCLL